MKKVVYTSIFSVMCLLLSSCSMRFVNSSSNTLDPEIRPIMADLEIKYEKITGTYSLEKSSSNVETLKRNAIFEALNSVKADVLIGTQFQTTEVVNSNGKVTERKVIVTGYPAYYKNFRPIPENVKNFDVKELKPETPYIITEKESNGNSKTYTVITTATKLKEATPVINLEDASLEEVVLRKDKKSSRK